MIALHQFEISPYCDKIRRVLHVKRQPYTVVEVPLTRAASIAKKNPARKLPLLEHDGVIVADSTDIAHYLERVFPEPALVPKDARLAALCSRTGPMRVSTSTRCACASASRRTRRAGFRSS